MDLTRGTVVVLTDEQVEDARWAADETTDNVATHGRPRNEVVAACALGFRAEVAHRVALGRFTSEEWRLHRVGLKKARDDGGSDLEGEDANVKAVGPTAEHVTVSDDRAQTYHAWRVTKNRCEYLGKFDRADVHPLPDHVGRGVRGVCVDEAR